MIDITSLVDVCIGAVLVLFLARAVYLIGDKVRKNWTEYKEIK